MKYFTKELWVVSQDINEMENTDKIWEENFRKYYVQLELLSDRLNQREMKFFRNGNLHDGTLISTRTFDSNYIGIEEKKKRPRKLKDPVCFEISVMNCEGTFLYLLRYEKVRSIHTEFSSEDQMFDDYYRSFGDWGYDEITGLDDNFLCHEILFSTGATIRIEFKNIKVIKTRIK